MVRSCFRSFFPPGVAPVGAGQHRDDPQHPADERLHPDDLAVLIDHLLREHLGVDVRRGVGLELPHQQRPDRREQLRQVSRHRGRERLEQHRNRSHNVRLDPDVSYRIVGPTEHGDEPLEPLRDRRLQQLAERCPRLLGPIDLAHFFDELGEDLHCP